MGLQFKSNNWLPGRNTYPFYLWMTLEENHSNTIIDWIKIRWNYYKYWHPIKLGREHLDDEWMEINVKNNDCFGDHDKDNDKLKSTIYRFCNNGRCWKENHVWSQFKNTGKLHFRGWLAIFQTSRWHSTGAKIFFRTLMVIGTVYLNFFWIKNFCQISSFFTAGILYTVFLLL